MKDVRYTEGQPHDRLTALGSVMSDALRAEEGVDDVQAIILLTEGAQGGSTIHGYDDDEEMLGHLMSHVQAIFTAFGLNVSIHAVEDPGDPRMN